MPVNRFWWLVLLAGGMTMPGGVYGENLALRARATASEFYQDLTPGKAIDGRAETRWSGIPGHNEGVWFQLEWDRPVRVGQVIIQQHERYTWEMDVQVWDEAREDWETVQHFGRPQQALPKVIVCGTAPRETTRLRIGNITNGPSFTEVEVYEDPALARPPSVQVASDLTGHLIGIVTDPWGSAPVEGAAVSLAGRCARGEWSAAARSDDKGLFTAPMPIGLTGMVRVTAQPGVAGAPRAERDIDAAGLPYGLTPLSFGARVVSLNGLWRFAPDPPKGFERPGFDDSDWAEIRVPAHWEMEGFRSANGVGGYRKTFAAPPGRGRLKLRFDGVYSGAEVFVNGTRLAYHEGGATPFEVDITEAAQEGGNVLAVRVTEHTFTSDELDKMSFYADFGLAGIIRKVTLFRVPAAHIGALSLATTFDGEYRDATLSGSVTMLNESGQALRRGSLRFSLTDPQGEPVPLAEEPVEVEVGAWERVEREFALRVRAPAKWEAEHPNLYRLTVELRSGGRLVQRLTQRIGFRQTEVRGSELHINGRPVKIRGSCHHDAHPLMGRAVTPELEWQDVALMREANLNALRTSHYPPLPELLDAADELGLYVEAEAPFCWVGVSNDLNNTPRIIQLTAELIARDRNHPCVFMWSLCNESEFGYGFERSHEWVRAADPSRPTGAGGSAPLEIATLHNPISLERMEQQEGLDRPLIWDESLAPFQGIWGDVAEMWVDPGIRDYYVEPLLPIYERLMQSKVVQGSMIWCWADDLFCVPGRGLEYGRGTPQSHFVEPAYRLPRRGIVGDAPWGVVDGWRRRKPEFWITKKLHSPVRVKEGPLPVPEAGAPIRVPVTNEYDFTDLAELTVTWTLGKEQGTAHAAVPPRANGEVVCDPKQPVSEGDALELVFRDAGGRVVDEYRLPVGEATTTGDSPRPSRTAGRAGQSRTALAVREESLMQGWQTVISGDGFEIAFNRGAWARVGGRLARFVVDGQPLLLEYPTLHVLPTDRPLLPLPERTTWELRRMEVSRSGDDVAVIVGGAYEGFEGEYRFIITPAGEMTGEAEFTRTGEDVLAREVGLRVSVPRECDLLRWDRQAEWSAYPEDHIGRPQGEARAFGAQDGARQRTGAPTRPWAEDASPLGSNDFRSTKRRINWATIGYPEGPGIAVESDGSQCARAMAESDRISLHISDWYGGTNVGLGEWVTNYGQGKLIRKGDVIRSQVRLRIVREVAAP